MRHASISLMVATLVALACAGESPPPGDRAGGPGDGPLAGSNEEPRRPEDGSPRARVLVLGTSLTAGMGLPDPLTEAWPARLQSLADSAGIGVEVINAGVSGDTSAGGLRRLDWLLRDPPQVLVVELGANDGLRGLGIQALEENLREIVTRARRANPEVRVVLAGMEAPPNLGPDYTAAFRETFPDLARELDTGLIPFLLEGVAGVPELNQPDAIHPTAAGHDRMARVAWPHLEPVLRAAASESSS